MLRPVPATATEVALSCDALGACRGANLDSEMPQYLTRVCVDSHGSRDRDRCDLAVIIYNAAAWAFRVNEGHRIVAALSILEPLGTCKTLIGSDVSDGNPQLRGF